MAAIFPPVPRFVFTVFEPISLVAGFVAPFISPEWFIAEQIPNSAQDAVSLGSKMVAYQLGNIYLLLAMVGIAVLYSTTEPKVVRNYIVALWIADIGHVVITGYAMGHDRVIDVANWNSMAWGNIGVTFGLFITRTAYLLGVFGPDGLPPKAKKVQ